MRFQSPASLARLLRYITAAQIILREGGFLATSAAHPRLVITNAGGGRMAWTSAAGADLVTVTPGASAVVWDVTTGNAWAVTADDLTELLIGAFSEGMGWHTWMRNAHVARLVADAGVELSYPADSLPAWQAKISSAAHHVRVGGDYFPDIPATDAWLDLYSRRHASGPAAVVSVPLSDSTGRAWTAGNPPTHAAVPGIAAAHGTTLAAFTPTTSGAWQTVGDLTIPDPGRPVSIVANMAAWWNDTTSGASLNRTRLSVSFDGSTFPATSQMARVNVGVNAGAQKQTAAANTILATGTPTADIRVRLETWVGSAAAVGNVTLQAPEITALAL